MATLMMLCATIVLLAISTSNAEVPFYQEVAGNCDELTVVTSHNNVQMSTGEFYFPYISFGSTDAKCASGHSIARSEDKTYIDFLLYENGKYINIPDDVTFQLSEPGKYKSDSGMNAYILASNLDDGFLFSLQCIVQDGQSNVLALIASRTKKLTKNAQKAYDDSIDQLTRLNLLPTMNEMKFNDCPPITADSLQE